MMFKSLCIATIRALPALLAGLFLAAGATAQAPEFRAQWADAFHHPLGTGSSSSMVQTMIDNIRAGNGNVVIPEVRVHADAMFVPHAEFYPNLGNATTGIGSINSNGVRIDCDLNSDPEPRRITTWDPLATVLARAHDTTGGRQRLDVWAWLVSFRSGTVHRTAHPTWLTRKPDGTVVDGDFDPGHPGVQQQLINVCADILASYDVDGLNFDYIRFTAVDNGYNPVSLARFNAQTGRTGIPSNTDPAWSDWRRDQVTNTVRKAYLTSIARKPSVKMSVDTITWASAPARPSSASTALTVWKNNFESTSRAYNETYQDWRSWMQEGITDLSIPMNYFGRCTYQAHYERWADFAKETAYNRQTIIGPGVYLNTLEDSIYQVKVTRNPSLPMGKSASGQALYSYASGPADACYGDPIWSPTTMASALSNGIPTDPTPAYGSKVGLPAISRLSNGKGHLMGTVTDPATPIPGWVDGATVTLTGPVNRSMKTDGTGFYGFVDLAPGSYTVQVAAKGLPTRTAPVTVTAYEVATLNVAMALPAAFTFVFTTQPGSAAPGQPLDPQPVLMAVDDTGARVSSFTGPVTLSIKGGTGGPGASLQGTVTVNAVNGVAIFDGLSVNVPGNGYVLVATSGALMPAESAAFDIISTATKLAFRAQPSVGISNLPFPVTPVVEVRDAQDRLVTDAAVPVTLSIQAGTGTDGAVLKGSVTVTLVNGVATFPDLRIDRSGSGYVLSAAAEGLTGTSSTAIDIAPRTARVSVSGSNAGDGLTWASALRTVSFALQNTGPGDEIWVAAGEYIERIVLRDGVGVYGGFAETETARDERNPDANVSTLNALGTGSVVTVPEGINRSSVLDGFTIRNGSGTVAGGPTSGGGVFIDKASPTVSNNRITGNNVNGDGGGIYVTGGAPLLSRNTVTGNFAERGAGIALTSGNAVLKSNVISGNSADLGGGLYVHSGSPAASNNTIATNVGTTTGSGVYVAAGSTPVLTNNIVALGTVGIAGESGASPVLRHNSVWVPGGVAYQNLTDPTGTDGNIQADPLFVDAGSGDFHLRPGSPAQDAGSDTVVVIGDLDRDGSPRRQGGAPDIGAFELAGFPPPTWNTVTQALRAAAGLDTPTPINVERMDVEAAHGQVDIFDAARLARQVAGLD